MNTRIALLTSLSLLLAACGQSTPQVSAPAPIAATPAPAPVGTPVTAPVTNPALSGTGATYEVTFQGANGGQLSASARYTGGFGALALQNSPDTLQFDPIASETFVTAGVRHIRATFKMTNKGTATLVGPVLVPVDTDDADSDPSNNGTSVPTVGTTPFNRVTYFDGSDASSKAASITVTGGKRFNANTGAAELDPNATPFLTNQDVSAVSASVPPELVVAGIKNYGWKVAESLAVNASANVTFAADLPADADPKNDPFRVTLVFTATVAGPTQIHDIQGSTPNGNAVSPFSGKALTVSGIVTADYQASGQLGGFFVQAPDANADSDPTTSEAVFVLCDATCKDVNVGDSVRLSGTVTEFNTITELTGVSNVVVSSSGNPLPTVQPITLPVATLNKSFQLRRKSVSGGL